MPSIERVWAQLKCKASEYATRRTTPTQVEAERYIAHLMAAEHVDPKPSREVIEFYARELITLAMERRVEEQPAR